ncbi:M14 family zinc carboxypeptidase [Verrucomicrobiota bacterium sgz303538]
MFRAVNWEEISFKRTIGKTVEGRDITVFGEKTFDFGAAMPDSTLLIGGMHGDETATVILLEDFLARYVGTDAWRTPTVVLPLANPDSYVHHSRYNVRGVDLNRNCDYNWSSDSVEPPGPGPWSEPEICALRDFILEWQPKKIVSLHWALAEIDADGPQSTSLAQAMWDVMSEAERRPYRLRVTELGRGQRRLQHTYQVCPGSLGQWVGYGLTYPDGSQPSMITLELPYDPTVESRPDFLPEEHLDTLRDLWHRDSGAYLRAVEPGVDKMLLAACNFVG